MSVLKNWSHHTHLFLTPYLALRLIIANLNFLTMLLLVKLSHYKVVALFYLILFIQLIVLTSPLVLPHSLGQKIQPQPSQPDPAEKLDKNINFDKYSTYKVENSPERIRQELAKVEQALKKQHQHQQLLLNQKILKAYLEN